MSAPTFAETINQTMGPQELATVIQPIDGEPAGKHFLSMEQLNEGDIHDYLLQAEYAQAYLEDPRRRGIDLLPFVVLKSVMRQPSTRTGGSVLTAIQKAGGSGDNISGMHASSEAKGESLADSWEAFATQADVIGTRTAEPYGPAFAAYVIRQAYQRGKLGREVPVINLGDGPNEHPTQAMGDLFTMWQHLGKLEGRTLAVVGDQERYRAFHSLLIGAATVGMTVVAVETPAVPAPDRLVERLGDRLYRTYDLDEAMRHADALYIGRNPDEYQGEDTGEQLRSLELADAYRGWRVDGRRIQQMSPQAILMHPRPRKDELDPSVDADPRAVDVDQMERMIPMRAVILARQQGVDVPKKGRIEFLNSWRIARARRRGATRLDRLAA